MRCHSRNDAAVDAEVDGFIVIAFEIVVMLPEPAAVE
jgi:hypothetical protein